VQILHPNCAGIDVHKKSLVVCHRLTDAQGLVQQECRHFSTMTEQLEALANWLAERGCTHVVMESTGVYWQPVYNILESRFEVLLANPSHLLKQAPGRKTDLNDAAWLAELLSFGLVTGSYIPTQQQRDLRELVRYRLSLVSERTRVANRLQKVLEDANIKLAAVASDIQGVSAQAMLRQLLEGVDDPALLADLARGSMRNKLDALEAALVGRLREHHRFMLRELLGHLDYLNGQIALFEQHIEEDLRKLAGFPEAVVLLDSIPGVDRLTAITIVAESGIDMSRFPSAAHLAAWAGMTPGNNESGGKQRPAAARKGNRYLRRVLANAAHGAGRTKGSYLRSLYWRLSARRGKPRAAMAVGRSILEIAYYLLKRHETYQELGENYLLNLDKERNTKRYKRQLELLGYEVELKERTAA
jgi:transposase